MIFVDSGNLNFIKLYKNLLRIGGGDSKQTYIHTYTHNVEIYILIIHHNMWCPIHFKVHIRTLIYKFRRCVCPYINFWTLSPPTIPNRFLKSLVFRNLHVSKIVHFYFHKDICIFEAAMASEASGNVCFITALLYCSHL